LGGQGQQKWSKLASRKSIETRPRRTDNIFKGYVGRGEQTPGEGVKRPKHTQVTRGTPIDRGGKAHHHCLGDEGGKKNEGGKGEMGENEKGRAEPT